MHRIKFFLTFLSLITYLILAHLLKAFLTFAKERTRYRALNVLTINLCRLLKNISGINLKITGNKHLLKEHGNFIIANHIGYIDGMVLGSIVPGSFVAKSEILEMSVINMVVKVCETIFVDSRKKIAIIRYNREMAKRLNDKINILIFPEGHSTDGSKVLPFYSAYFDVPLKTHNPIVPLSIEFEKIDGVPIKNCESLYFNETMSFFPHLLNILKFKRIDITVKVHDKIEIKEYDSNSKDRKFVANYCQNILASYKKEFLSQETTVEPEERELLEV